MSDARERILLKRGQALKAQSIQSNNQPNDQPSLYPIARATGIDQSLSSRITTRAASRRQASVDVNNPPLRTAQRSHSQQPSLSFQSFIDVPRSSSVHRADDEWQNQTERLNQSSRSPSAFNSPSNASSSTPSARSQHSNQSRSVPLSPIDQSPEPGEVYSDDSDFEHVEPGAPLPTAQPVQRPVNQPNNPSQDPLEMFRNPFLDDLDQSKEGVPAFKRGRSRATTTMSRMTMSKAFDERSLPARMLGRATMSFAAELSSLEDHPAIKRLTVICDSLPFISTLSHKFNVSSLYVTILLCIAAVLMSLNVLGLTQLVSILTLLYPCYMSYHTLEDEDGDGEHVNTRSWLVYWCVFGATRCFTVVLDHIFTGTAYAITKLAFTIFCFHPATRGCDVVFNYFIHPLYRANREAIEHATDTLTYFISDVIDESKAIMKSAVVGAIAGHAHERPARRARQASQIKAQ